MHTDSRDYQASTSKTLVSTGPFNAEFYTYTVSKNPATGVTTGAFSVVSGATPSTCPRGRVLHLTGRKLYPDVNPMNTFVGTALTAKKFLVAVYDPISFLNGFIDPTSNTFAKFDQNVPNFFNLGRDGSGVQWPGGGAGAELILADAGASSTIANNATFAAGNASVGQVTYNGGATGSITVSSTAVTANSKIFLSSLVSNTNAYVSSVSAGSFTIYFPSNGTYTLNFLIVN